MPEGDTIFRAAQTLQRALAGRTVTGFESVYPLLTRVHVDSPLTGRRVESVTARGKHLLMAFTGDLVLRTHMRMHGSWHLYRPGEPWRRPARDMRIAITTDAFVAVGFNVPDAEFLTLHDLDARHPLERLGPDLLAPDFDADEALRRIREQSEQPIGEVLLNQRVLAGIGNVFKSEILYVARVHPLDRVVQLEDRQVRRILEIARRQLRINVAPQSRSLAPTFGRRTTGSLHPGKGLWVYGRAGEPCRTCGTPIVLDKHSVDARLTYWCPTCQSRRPD